VTVLAPHLTEQLVAAFAEELAPLLAAELAAQLPQPATAEPWHLLNLEQAAERLGRSARWIRERAKRGDLPFVRLDGGALAFEEADLRAFAQARRIAAEEPEALAARLQAGRDPAARNGLGGPDAVAKPEGSAMSGGWRLSTRSRSRAGVAWPFAPLSRTGATAPRRSMRGIH
jgi:predicted DNA-binding transcriptional regulator AlpA